MAVIFERIKDGQQRCKETAEDLLQIVKDDPSYSIHFDVEDIIHAKNRLDDLLRLIYQYKNRDEE